MISLFFWSFLKGLKQTLICWIKFETILKFWRTKLISSEERSLQFLQRSDWDQVQLIWKILRYKYSELSSIPNFFREIYWSHLVNTGPTFKRIEPAIYSKTVYQSTLKYISPFWGDSSERKEICNYKAMIIFTFQS